MEKDLQRALRRHHRARLKRNRRYHYWWREDKSPTQLGKLVNTPTLCSCWMCGNPRRYFTDDTPLGLTIQEVKQRNYADSFDDDDDSDQ